MKITILMQDFFWQGAQYAMAAVARGLIAKGIEVELLTSQVHKDLIAANNGRETFALPTEAKLLYLPSRRARENISAVRKYLKNTDSRAVLSTSGPYHMCLRLSAIGLRRHPLLVCVDHGNFGWDEENKCVVTRYPIKKRFKFRLFYSGFDRVLFVNEFSRRNFLKHCLFYDSAKTATVYNPVVDDRFMAKLGEAPTHQWLTNHEFPVVVAVGALSACKDHYTLFEAIRLVNEHIKVRLVLFGRGVLDDEYHSYIAKHHLEDVIALAGFTDNVPANMRAADVVVSSSIHESFSIVLVEALAAGTPVISTDAPFGPREVLAGGKYGTLVPVGDVQAMARAIEDVVTRSRPVIPDAAWNRFTVAKVTDNYLAALQ